VPATPAVVATTAKKQDKHDNYQDQFHENLLSALLLSALNDVASTTPIGRHPSVGISNK
jgi:hypothetical protein